VRIFDDRKLSRNNTNSRHSIRRPAVCKAPRPPPPFHRHRFLILALGLPPTPRVFNGPNEHAAIGIRVALWCLQSCSRDHTFLVKSLFLHPLAFCSPLYFFFYSPGLPFCRCNVLVGVSLVFSFLRVSPCLPHPPFPRVYFLVFLPLGLSGGFPFLFLFFAVTSQRGRRATKVESRWWPLRHE